MLYRQGATAADEVVVPAGGDDPLLVEIPVYHVGATQAGDRLLVQGDEFKELEVTAVNADAGLIEVFNGMDTDIAVHPLDRLIISTGAPTIYTTPIGTDPLPAPYSLGADGRLYGYVTLYRFDFTVRISATSLRIFPDAEGSYVMR